MPSWTFARTISSELIVFKHSFSLTFCFCDMRKSRLSWPFCQLLSERKYISYRIHTGPCYTTWLTCTASIQKLCVTMLPFIPLHFLCIHPFLFVLTIIPMSMFMTTTDNSFGECRLNIR